MHDCAQIDVTIQNTVTLGATVLNNNSASYASYAILMDQAIGHQVPLASLGTAARLLGSFQTKHMGAWNQRGR